MKPKIIAGPDTITVCKFGLEKSAPVGLHDDVLEVAGDVYRSMKPILSHILWRERLSKSRVRREGWRHWPASWVPEGTTMACYWDGMK